MNDVEIIRGLIKYWRRSFFTEPILLSAFVACFIACAIYHHKQRERLFFLFYFFVGITLLVVNSPLLFRRIYQGRNLAIHLEISNTLFELAEFAAFYIFFSHTLRTKSFQKMSRIFLLTLCSIIGTFFVAIFFLRYSADKIDKHSFLINVVEFFFIAILCLTYFYELFKYAPSINLLHRPSFFITASAFFYSVSLIPFFIIANDMFKNQSTYYHILFACHFLLLTVVLLSLLSALLCKDRITT
jgi:hypothetical protein